MAVVPHWPASGKFMMLVFFLQHFSVAFGKESTDGLYSPTVMPIDSRMDCWSLYYQSRERDVYTIETL